MVLCETALIRVGQGMVLCETALIRVGQGMVLCETGLIRVWQGMVHAVAHSAHKSGAGNGHMKKDRELTMTFLPGSMIES